MFAAFHRKTGKICCAMLARDLAEAIGHRHYGVDCAIAWFPHADFSAGVDHLRVVRTDSGVALVIG